MNTKELTTSFLEDLVLTRKYDKIRYVEAGHYVKRLNRAFEHNWNLEILEVQKIDTYVLVRVRLTAGSIIKESFGGSFITKKELADAYKSAVTDGMKKCAWMLGIGVGNWLDLDEEVIIEAEMDRKQAIVEVERDRKKAIIEKEARKDLIARTKYAFEAFELVGEGARKTRAKLLVKHFGTENGQHIFSSFPIGDLEKGVLGLEADLAGGKDKWAKELATKGVDNAV